MSCFPNNLRCCVLPLIPSREPSNFRCYRLTIEAAEDIHIVTTVAKYCLMRNLSTKSPFHFLHPKSLRNRPSQQRRSISSDKNRPINQRRAGKRIAVAPAELQLIFSVSSTVKYLSTSVRRRDFIRSFCSLISGLLFGEVARRFARVCTETRKHFWGIAGGGEGPSLTVREAGEPATQPTAVYLRILFAAGEGKLAGHLLIFASRLPGSGHFPKMFVQGNDRG